MPQIVYEISTLDLSYVVKVKSAVKISQNFVAFSEYMNFSSNWLTVGTESNIPELCCEWVKFNMGWVGMAWEHEDSNLVFMISLV